MSILDKISSLNSDLLKVGKTAKNVCLHLSGGAESVLLLEAIIKLRLNFAIVHFDDGLGRDQRKTIWTVIKRHQGLQIFSFPARAHLLIGKHKQLALASYYAISANQALPVVRDIIPGKKCAFDLKLELSPTQAPPLEFDVIIRGSRFLDSHWSVKRVLSQKETIADGKLFLAPLADWLRVEVLEALRVFGVDYRQPIESQDTGNISACSLCLHGKPVICPKTNSQIPPVEWDRNKNLNLFRKGKFS